MKLSVGMHVVGAWQEQSVGIGRVRALSGRFADEDYVLDLTFECIVVGDEQQLVELALADP
jgi:hypothetical protein